jgi:hypothetical protein
MKQNSISVVLLSVGMLIYGQKAKPIEGSSMGKIDSKELSLRELVLLDLN